MFTMKRENSISLYANGEIGNHGCEALYRSLGDIFHIDEIFTWMENTYPQQLWAGIYANKSPIHRFALRRFSYDWLIFRLTSLWRDTDYAYYRRILRGFSKQITPGRVYASVGGDNYCYGACQWLYALNDIIRNRKGYTVFLGCSVTPEDMDRMMLDDLARFDLIIARESITYDALKNNGIHNVELLPDPAFALAIEECELPASFKSGMTVGINMSPLIMRYERRQGLVIQNVETLIRYILNDTEMNVALIPHVVLPENDDIEAMRPLYERFASTGRVSLVPNLNCSQLKYIIGQCRYLVTARTHASIAAYSQAVPTLVMGYSVKAEGIAKDLFGTAEHYVKDVRTLNDENSILSDFHWLMENEDKIKSHYRQYLPRYVEPLSRMPQIVQQYLASANG